MSTLKLKTKDYASACEVLGGDISVSVHCKTKDWSVSQKIIHMSNMVVLAEAINKESDFVPQYGNLLHDIYYPVFSKHPKYGWIYQTYNKSPSGYETGILFGFKDLEHSKYFADLVIELKLLP